MNQTKSKKFSKGLEKLSEINATDQTARHYFWPETDTSIYNKLIHFGFPQANTLTN